MIIIFAQKQKQLDAAAEQRRRERDDRRRCDGGAKASDGSAPQRSRGEDRVTSRVPAAEARSVADQALAARGMGAPRGKLGVWSRCAQHGTDQDQARRSRSPGKTTWWQYDEAYDEAAGDADEEIQWGHMQAERGMRSLAACLMVNETLQHLDIAGNGIGVDLFLLLCDGLLLNHSLTYLDVSSNALGPDAGAALGQLLANSTAGLSPSADRQTADESGTPDQRGGNGSRRTPMPPLATCVCGANGLGDQGAAGFAAQIADNACLMRLDLSANDFSDSGFRQLGPALANNLHALTHLSLASNRLSLHSLSPFFSEVHTSEAFEARPPECHLDRLALVLGFHHSMPRSSLLNSGAPAGLELLARLDLSCTGIGDLGALACMAGLSGHRCLEEIVLSSSLLTDIGAAAVGACIYSCPRMRVLCLSQNHVTSIGLIALFRWLLAQGCRGFRAPHCRLILRGNRIGSPPAGTQMRSDEEMLATIEHILKTHVALTELDLRGNPIAEAAEQVMRQVAAERDKYRCKFRFAPGSATMAGVSSSGEDEWIEAGDEEEVEQFETELRQLHIKLVDMGFARSHVDHVLTRHFNFHDAFRQLKALD